MLTKEQLKKIEDFAKEQNSEREWIHVRQIRPIAAELAKKAGCKKLMLTHILPGAGHNKVLEKCKKLFKDTILAEDLKEVII